MGLTLRRPLRRRLHGRGLATGGRRAHRVGVVRCTAASAPVPDLTRDFIHPGLERGRVKVRGVVKRVVKLGA